MLRIALQALVMVALLACSGASSVGADTVAEADTPATTASPGTPTTLTPSEAVALHNEARRTATPAPATPLAPMRWSRERARRAQAWAERCQWGHSEAQGYGENLFVTTRRESGSVMAEAIASWVAEQQHYDLCRNRCSEVCGHYTQVVWDDTTEVGCGVAVCQSVAGLDDYPQGWVMVVCQYEPPGNYRGQRPYESDACR